MLTFDDQPLRQRKLARTRLALLQALTEQLEIQTYEAIRIKDLCSQAEISEASFFNHFHRKEDLLVYFIQIWSLSIGWHARKVLAEHGALAAIEDVFARTAAEISPHPRVMAELIAFQARREIAIEMSEPTTAERLLAHPELDGIEAVPARGLDAILPELLASAIEHGELPAGTDAQFLFISLATIFFGAPVVLRANDPSAVGEVWRKQLAQLFDAAKAKPAQLGRKRSAPASC